MSYDVYLSVDTGAPELVSILQWNYTSNCAVMWRHSGVDLRKYNKALCSEAAGPLTTAVKRMKEQPEVYRAMNPENGWGDYEGALNFLEEIASACAEHPSAIMEVSF